MQLLTLLVFFLSAPVVVQSTPGYWNGRGFSSRLVSVPNKDRGGTCGYPSKRWAFRQTVKEEASTTLCEIDEEATDRDVARIIVRGGDNLDSNRNNLLDDSVNVALKVITTGCRTILPPAVALVRAVIAFYTVLPVDAILGIYGAFCC